MILKEEVFPVGKLLKTHGTQGEISFTSTYDLFGEVDIPFIILEPQGLLVPFYVENVRMRQAEIGIIKLERIDSDEAALEYLGQIIYLPESYLHEIEEDDLEADYFVGFELVDIKKGRIGRIVELDDDTENILFVVEEEDDELLIPVADEFVVEIKHEERVLVMDLPLGLLEL